MEDDMEIPESQEQEQEAPQELGVWQEGMPEEWKGKSKSEITSLWTSAATVLDAKNAEVEALRQQLEAARTQREYTAPPPPPVPQEDPVDFRSLIFDDPEKAIDFALEKKYGRRVQEMDQTQAEIALMKVEREFPDFDRHRDTINSILAQNKGTRISDHTVRAAYLMAKGNAAIQAEAAARAAAIHSQPPTPPGPAAKKVEITSLEQEVARAMGFESDEEFAEWRDSDDEITVEVPRGNR
jgi:Asp-tRNA(Asn)/Glu-tRNA(Gln) amidotransferase A subunit family amidase